MCDRECAVTLAWATGFPASSRTTNRSGGAAGIDLHGSTSIRPGPSATCEVLPVSGPAPAHGSAALRTAKPAPRQAGWGTYIAPGRLSCRRASCPSPRRQKDISTPGTGRPVPRSRTTPVIVMVFRSGITSEFSRPSITAERIWGGRAGPADPAAARARAGARPGRSKGTRTGPWSSVVPVA